MVNQCLEHQPTVEITTSTALTALEPSLTAWAYSVKCTSTANGIHRNVYNVNTPCTPFSPVNLTTTANPTITNDSPPTPPDFSCPVRAQVHLKYWPRRSPLNPSHGGRPVLTPCYLLELQPSLAMAANLAQAMEQSVNVAFDMFLPTRMIDELVLEKRFYEILQTEIERIEPPGLSYSQALQRDVCAFHLLALTNMSFFDFAANNTNCISPRSVHIDCKCCQNWQIIVVTVIVVTITIWPPLAGFCEQ
ncbi:unnamed protein product [Schistocephalus solidus]|uniref:Uncharacterized protein n=1 Tax=Schistocephalus solidus TaxID=70667 RepID=A0A3P7DPJ5_SCHSO|nr:unnamed protein product [Schistocephalus solidus]